MDAQTEARLVTETLVRRHPSVDPALIEQLVRHRFEGYATAKITSFLPVLVQREVRRKLAIDGGDQREPSDSLPPVNA